MHPADPRAKDPSYYHADVSPISGNYRGTLERKMTVEVMITPVA